MLAGGLLFGGIFFGLHPMITLSGSTVGVWHGLGLIVLSCLYGLAAMACIVSMALLFSTITDSSLTALIATIVIYIVITVLIQFSYFDWLRPWVFPQYLLGVHQLLPRPDLLAADPQGAGRLRALERRADAGRVSGLPAQGRAVVG